MKPFAYVLAVLICVGGSPSAWAQHGHGRGGGPPSGARTMSPATTAPARSADLASNAHVSTRDPLAHNPALSSRLQPLLPSGANVQAASQGFQNAGQFVAAVHVSRNLNIPFEQLKTRMTGPHEESLGQAIQALRPDIDRKQAKEEAKRAEKQARDDLKEAEKSGR